MPDWTAGPFKPENGHSALGGAVDGVLARYFKGNQRGFVKIPDALSFEEAATLPTAALTAWNALFEVGDLKPGETVLVQGFRWSQRIRTCSSRSPRVLGSSRSQEVRRRLGGSSDWARSHVIRHEREPEWSRAVLEATGGVGVDHVVETGGAGTIDESIKATATGGSISLVGLLTGAGGRLDMLPI